ncbi:hypothetical protein BJ138DRAFT_1128247 [Hygrophoropsis aurantiaca]|uniref:Uncharacterized protein n=1 Tax=Hygrophoropsis aurantiaca TaxID=72124 RepID=A0ACB8A6V2_9AGAM|nr:hypothetical protein BJ138DRAFT_1128247 [Hygrophoropsis aurantiaca]
MAPSVEASLKYFLPPSDGTRPYTNINADPKTGKMRHNWVEHESIVQIENIRGTEDQFTLDNAGFQFYRAAPKHTSFTDDAEIEKEYYPESIELIKKLTGASSAVIFDHTIRRRRPGEADDSPQRRQPVPLVHVDQTNRSSVARVHRHLPVSEAPSLLKRRFQIINLWRPISHTALDWPLALCDFRSVDVKKDLLAVALIYPDREGETYGVTYNPGHKWKYLKGMETDELVLIKCFDSLQDGSVAILTPHTGFEDPSTPEGSPLRESIELRALVFYD